MLEPYLQEQKFTTELLAAINQKVKSVWQCVLISVVLVCFGSLHQGSYPGAGGTVGRQGSSLLQGKPNRSGGQKETSKWDGEEEGGVEGWILWFVVYN